MCHCNGYVHIINIREELSRRGSDWQYIFEMEHLPLLPTKPSLIEGRYPTVGHFEGKMFSSWACEPGCYSTKPVLKWITCPTADYLSSKMPNCQYSREVVGISFDQLEVEFYVQLTLYWVRGLPLICLCGNHSDSEQICGFLPKLSRLCLNHDKQSVPVWRFQRYPTKFK